MSRNGSQDSEVESHDYGNKDPKHCKKLALRDQIGLAGLIDQLGDLAHRAVDRQILQLKIDRKSEQETEDAEDESDQQQRVAVHAEEIDSGEIRKTKTRFATGILAGRLSESHRALE